MKVRGLYILSLRSIKRMIAVIAVAFSVLCSSAVCPNDVMLVRRCTNVAQALVSLKLAIAAHADRIAVLDFVYLESKALYLTLKSSAVTPFVAMPVRRYATRKAISMA